METLTSRKLSICNIRIDAIQRGELIALVDDAIASDEKILLFNHNLHSLYLYKTNAALRRAYARSSFVYIDGLPVVWLARLAGLKVGSEDRLTLLDSFEHVIETAVKRRWRIFYLGSSASVLENGLQALQTAYPGLSIAGLDGYFDKGPEGSLEVVRQINMFKPDVLFVGLGMPLQELWLVEYFDRLSVKVATTSGATLDYVAGAVYKPPSWAGPLGLYGILRLCADPKRLWRRYLLEPIILLGCLLPDIVWQRLQGPVPAEK